MCAASVSPRTTVARTLSLAAAVLLFAAPACETEPTSNDDEDDGGSASVTIDCGTVVCQNECCPSTETCTGQDCINPENGHGFYMTCDGPEDCGAGTVCCAAVGAAAYGQTDCRSVDECTGAGLISEVVCRQNADCPAGLSCQPSQLRDTFTMSLLGCQ